MTSSSGLPSFPLELKHEILKFCDPSTLAQTSRVSLAFLELSSPLLYTHVEIQGSGQLERMLLARDSSHQPQLSAVLSLDQIKTFTFTEPRITIPSPTFPLCLDRFTSSTHSLQRLSIFLPFTIEGLLAPAGNVFPLALVCLQILNILHPVHLHVEGIVPSRSVEGAVIEREGEHPPVLPSLGRQINPNLRTLHFKNALGSFGRNRQSLRGVFFDFSEDLGEAGWFLWRNVIWHKVFDSEPEVAGPEVVVRVGSEDRRRELLVVLRQKIERKRVEEDVTRRWLKQVEAAVRL